jgi:hypothetical protein
MTNPNDIDDDALCIVLHHLIENVPTWGTTKGRPGHRLACSLTGVWLDGIPEGRCSVDVRSHDGTDGGNLSLRDGEACPPEWREVKRERSAVTERAELVAPGLVRLGQLVPAAIRRGLLPNASDWLDLAEDDLLTDPTTERVSGTLANLTLQPVTLKTAAYIASLFTGTEIGAEAIRTWTRRATKALRLPSTRIGARIVIDIDDLMRELR